MNFVVPGHVAGNRMSRLEGDGRWRNDRWIIRGVSTLYPSFPKHRRPELVTNE